MIVIVIEIVIECVVEIVIEIVIETVAWRLSSWEGMKCVVVVSDGVSCEGIVWALGV